MRDPLTDRGDVTGGSTDATERSSACSTGASQSSPRPIRFAVRRATPPTRPASCRRSPARTCWSPTRTGASLRPTPPRATPTAGPWSTSTPSLPTPADLSAGSCLDAATAFNALPSPGEVVDLYVRSESNGPYPTCSEWLANGVNPSQTTPLAAVQRPAALDQATQHVTAETFHARRSVGDGLPPWTY